MHNRRRKSAAQMDRMEGKRVFHSYGRGRAYKYIQDIKYIEDIKY